MEKIFVLCFFITLLFCFAKFLEMKYLEKEWKPLKYFIRDSVIVFGCSFAGSFVYFYFQNTLFDFYNIITESKVINTANTQVFTDSPGF